MKSRSCLCAQYQKQGKTGYVYFSYHFSFDTSASGKVITSARLRLMDANSSKIYITFGMGRSEKQWEEAKPIEEGVTETTQSINYDQQMSVASMVLRSALHDSRRKQHRSTLKMTQSCRVLTTTILNLAIREVNTIDRNKERRGFSF